MKHSVRQLTFIAAFLLSTSHLAGADPRPIPSRAKLPLSFAPNVGQAEPDVAFVARGRQYAIGLTAAGARVGVEGSTMAIDFVGANRQVLLVPDQALPGTANYFLGSDRERWRTGVPTYRAVRAANVYDGIDVVYYGTGGLLEYDFVVRPGADPSVIRVALRGARAIKVTAEGELAMTVDGRVMRQRKPFIYQNLPDGRREIGGRYRVGKGGVVRFSIGGYDRTRPLVIDPVLVYSSYSGGPLGDSVRVIAVDTAGSAYLAGEVAAVGEGTGDATLTKIDPTGSFIVYSAFLGGSALEYALAVAVDAGGSAYVTGVTRSTDFPTRSAFQTSFGGGIILAEDDAFVAKFSPQGALVYSTYLGGFSNEQGNAIGVTPDGEAVVMGATASPNFPVANALQPVLRGPRDAFVTRLAASGSRLIYSTYVGGSEDDGALAGALDAAGNVYITGTTNSTDFPVVSPFQSAPSGGNEAFVAKLTADGSAIGYATYLGGSSQEFMGSLGVTGDGRAIVCGTTNSTDFPTANAAQPELAGFFDAFVVLFEASGSSVAYATYFGGSDGDACEGAAIDASGHAHVTGRTDSTDFPLRDALQPNPGGGGDAFVTTIAPSGIVAQSTYLGGSGWETGDAISYDRAGAIYVAGYLDSADFPVTPAAFQRTRGDAPDGFVSKIGAMCGPDVTSALDLGALLSLKIPLTPWRLELVLVRNHSTEPLGGPLSLVLTDLSNGAFAGSPWTTSCFGDVASPFTIVTGGHDGILSPGEIGGQWLLFYEPGAAVSYAPRVLSGVPGR